LTSNFLRITNYVMDELAASFEKLLEREVPEKMMLIAVET